MKLHLLLVQVQTWDCGQVERLGRHKLVITGGELETIPATP